MDDCILGKQGMKGPTSHFAQDDESYLASNAPRYPQCEICDFLVGQHPEPFNNFEEIGYAPLVLKDRSKNVAPYRSVARDKISVKGDWGRFRKNQLCTSGYRYALLAKTVPIVF